MDSPRGVEIFKEVISHRHTGLYDRHHLAKCFRRGMDLGTYRQSTLRCELELLDHVRHGDKAFVDSQISILRIFRKPFIRVGITAEHKLEAVPFDNETYRTIQRVNCRDGANRHAVFLIDDRIHSLRWPRYGSHADQ